MLRTLFALLPLAAVAAVLLALPFAAAAQSPSPSPSATTTTATAAASSTEAPGRTPRAPSTPVTPTPSPAGTPWPAPANLRVTTEANLLDANNVPLPPERQEHTDVLRWDHLPAFTGEYEVEVTLVPYGGGQRMTLRPFMRFPAERGAGEIRRVSQYPEWIRNVRCFRIRTTIPSGAGTIETGAWSNEACTQRPPSSGPGGFELVWAGIGVGYSDDFSVTFVDFHWLADPAFPGTWEVDRAFVPRENAQTSIRDFETMATLPASVSDGTWGRYKEQVSSSIVFVTAPCYRVRGVVDGRTVAVSDERCAVLPPDAYPPRVPDAGTGLAAAHPGTWFLLASAALVAFGVGSATAVAASVSRRRR